MCASGHRGEQRWLRSRFGCRLQGAPTKRPAIPRSAAVGCGRVDKMLRQAMPPAPKQAGHCEGGGVVYDEVVRGRRDRQALPAWACPDCARFYAAIERQGNGVGRPACAACQHGAPAGAAGPSSRADALQLTGRHRAMRPAPATPKGYWNIGFSDDSL